MANLVEIAIPVPVDRTFTYAVPAGREAMAQVGRRVTVPFGKKQVRGFVVGKPETTAVEKVKNVTEFLDDGPVLGPDVLDLGRFVSSWYGCSIGEALDAMLPSGVKHGRAGRTVPHAALAISVEQARAAAAELPDSRVKQARILEILADAGEPVPVADLRRAAHASRSPVTTLAKAGLVTVRRRPLPDDPFTGLPAERKEPPVLTAQQESVLAKIRDAVTSARYETFLLFGITASGKTEIYLRAIEECRARGRQAIVLVPEISLTPQTVRRFRARFDRVAVLHSAQSEAERRRSWKTAQAGEADVVIGPRSAVFAPVPSLGLVVVDEEHDGSFKQGRSPRYHARDVAIVRAKAVGAAVVLGSATPALESFRNARTGKFTMLTLTERVGGGELPPVEVVDMSREMSEQKRFTWLSRHLRRAVTESLSRGEQAMLFLNRRGFTPVLSCRRCGEPLSCERCSVPMVYHQRRGRAACHQCGAERRVPEVCPLCAQPGLLHQGYGTERIEDEIEEHFPGAAVARMDSDTMTRRGAHEAVLERLSRREIDILVGTQMIAKGLHFPRVTTVGVIDADTSLRVPDFRASERTFQLIAQVAGRTGRSDMGGRVVVQTYRKGQPAIEAAARHDYLAFAEDELRARERLGYPPSGRVLLAVVQGKHAGRVAERAAEVARDLRQAIPREAARILGPAVPPLERIKDRFRRHVMVVAKEAAGLRAAVRLLRGQRARKRGVDVVLDVDPVSMM
ncbi:MAG: primosomal protein N' [Planctomycetota bacterium]